MRFKNCKHKNLKLEADFTDPIWCVDCHWNFEVDDFPISEVLVEEINEWAVKYVEIYDMVDSRKQDAAAIKREHNNMGRTMTERLQKELDDRTIIFSPIDL
jgi:hypothetical protein